MTTYRELFSLVVPRCKAAPTPAVDEIVRHPPAFGFLLGGLRPGMALAHDLGNVWPHEYEPDLPYRERTRMLPIGRVVAFRDGLLFLPNTHLAIWKDVGNDLKKLVKHIGAEYGPHVFVGDKEIAKALGHAVELIELFADDHDVAHAGHKKDESKLPSAIRSSLAKKGAIILPYAELVHAAVIEANPSNLWQRMTFPRRDLLYLVREDAAGNRRAFCFNLASEEEGFRPFLLGEGQFAFGLSPDYQDGKLSPHEAAATVLIGACAESLATALWLAAERERLGGAALDDIQEQAMKVEAGEKRATYFAAAVADLRKRHDTTNPILARIVLERLGETADALARAPYAKHGVPDMIAYLKKTAA